VIPEHVLTFIRSSIKSVWALDLLILIRRARVRSWTLDALAQELRGNRTLVNDVLSALMKAGVIQADTEGSYRYWPATPDLDALVEQLDRLYAERPVALIKEIVSAPNEKIQSFADAFKIKKE
jgi:predicted transcriptional regulator